MPEKRYTVYYDGKVEEGRDPAAVRAELARILTLTAEEAELLPMDEPTVVAGNVDKDTAMGLRISMLRAGAAVTVKATEMEEGKQPAAEGPWKTIACPHCGTRQMPARECKHCGQSMKKKQA
ncbi:MAG: hypothetical protein AB1921_16235 [Thermodesulfobacteriota bacterium]